MFITLDLPDELNGEIRRRAEMAGQTPEAYAAGALRRQLAEGELQVRHQLEDIAWALALGRESR